jgi:hypothetical protein
MLSDEPEVDRARQPGPVRVSIAAQLDPLWRHGRAGESGVTDLEAFAQGMTAYIAENLERFADPRGADVFVRVVIDRDGETGGHEYRSGHFLGEAGEPAPVTPEGAGNESAQAAATREDGGS